MTDRHTRPFPHDNLYTRIKPSRIGVGVYAIRPIPEGTPLFAGDAGAITRVPVSEVEGLLDLEIRQMYYDFCPVIDGSYIAPIDFNQLTMGWYLNHSHNPNVIALDEMHFITARAVASGEELTSDYSTYSEHSAQFIRKWSNKGERV